MTDTDLNKMRDRLYDEVDKELKYCEDRMYNDDDRITEFVRADLIRAVRCCMENMRKLKDPEEAIICLTELLSVLKNGSEKRHGR